MSRKPMSHPDELDLIQYIKQVSPAPLPNVTLGIGDDAAILETARGMQVLVTADALLEGVHFLSDSISPCQLGRKSVAVNLSDIAAMGGTPQYLLLTLAIPRSLPSTWTQEFIKGIASACRDYSLTLVGGDLSRSLERVALAITLIGEIERGHALQRGGARPGDLIFATGDLGEAGAGMECILAGGPRDRARGKLIRRALDPVPRLACGKFLSTHRYATAAIDLSDGLSSDLYQICGASGVGAMIHEARLPISPNLRRCESLLKNNATHYALNGGEDYELLFTVSPEAAARMTGQWPGDFPCLSEIGVVLEKEKGVSMMGLDGTSQRLVRGGFDHFRDS